jgi:ABC-type bacteriocin/lantibiotic exporter with double-glycine peptidase domain
VRWNRAVVLAAGLAVLAHGVYRNAWLAWPEVHGDGRVPGPDHHVMQSSHYTCGPAACAAALSHCGIVVSERDLAAACLTRREGTRLFDLYRGVVQTIGDRPFDVSIEAVDPEQIVAEQLVVVGANPGRGHAICIATCGSRLVVHDPLRPVAQRCSLQLLRDEFRPPAIVIRARTVAMAAPGR